MQGNGRPATSLSCVVWSPGLTENHLPLSLALPSTPPLACAFLSAFYISISTFLVSVGFLYFLDFSGHGKPGKEVFFWKVM